MNDAEKIDLILEWAQDNIDFDITFVESLADKVEAGTDLTKSQSDALDNIIEKWRIQ